MTPWLWASSLIAASSDDDDEEESVRRAALGLPPLSLDPGSPSADRGGRTVFEMFEDREDEEEGLVYTVDIGDGYAMRAFAEYHEALSEGEGMVDSALNDGGTDEIFVTKYEHVPETLRLRALLHGVQFAKWRNQILDRKPDDYDDFGDGYEMSSALSPYLSEEKSDESGAERGVVWKWNLHEDEKFEDWPSDKQEDHRGEVFYRNRAKEALPAGLLLHLRTTEIEPFEEALKAGREQNGSGGSGIDDPIVVSTRKALAPMDPVVPQTAGKGSSIITLELQEQIDGEDVVVVPWIPAKSKGQFEVDEISESLGESVDPKTKLFLDDISSKAAEQSKHFKVLVVTMEDGSGILFLDPSRRDVQVRVVRIEPLVEN